jgi:acetyl-CoA synthetase
MKLEKLPVIQGDYNLKDYEETYKNFDWSEVEKQFSWAETGRVNMAYEAIDRHVETFRKNKVALYYRDASREEKYTFK